MININLLPPELKLKRIEAKRNASLLNYCVALVLIFLILGIVARFAESTAQAYFAADQNQIDRASAQLDQYQEVQDMALFIRDRWQASADIEKKHIYWSRVMQELTNCVPQTVQFETLSIDMAKTPNFSLTANTTSENEIIKFKDKLEASDTFQAVNFKTSQLSTEANATAQKLEFSLEFNLENKTQD